MTRRRFLALALVLMAAFLCVRFSYLLADPPMKLPNGGDYNELVVEPTAKAHEARNRALFGWFQTSPVDNYQFWRIQSPAWVYPLSWFFRATNVSYPSLRTYAILGSALGFFAFLVLAAQKLKGTPFAAVALFFGFNFDSCLYSRYGLIEPQVNSLLILTVLFVHLARREILWLAVAELTLTAAFLTKQTAFFLAPVCLVAGALALWRARHGTPPWKRLVPVVLGFVIAGGLVYYVRQPAYMRTLAWNYGHMALGTDGAVKIEVEKFPLKAAFLRAIDLERWGKTYFALFPIGGTLAIFEIVRTLRAVVRRRFDPWDLLVAGWGLSAWGALLLTPLVNVRFFLILFPPVALLAGRFLAAAKTQWGWRSWPRHVTFAVPLSAFLCVHGAWYADYVRTRQYELVRANARVRKKVGANKNAVVIGLWAAPLVFETPFVQYYVKNNFNATKRALVTLAPTHFLLIDGADYTKTILGRQFPGLVKRMKPIDVFRVRKLKLELFELKQPLR